MATKTILLNETNDNALLQGTGNPNLSGIDPGQFTTASNVNYINSASNGEPIIWVYKSSAGAWVPDATNKAQWVNVGTFLFSDFSVAAVTNTITAAYSLPARTTPMACYIEVVQTFVGGTITSYTASVGNLTSFTKYHSAQNIHTIPPSPIQPELNIGIETSGDITITATSGGDTLDNAIQGQINVYLFTSPLP